jgi:WD40 repeat protein
VSDALVPRTFDHDAPVTAGAINLENSLVLWGDQDGTVTLQPARGGRPRWRVGALFRGPVRGCSLSSDGELLVLAYDDGTLGLWAPLRRWPIARLEGHKGRVNGCAVSPDGGFIVSASEDGTLRVWSPEGGPARALLEGHSGPVRACAVSPDGRFIVSASEDGTLRVWSPQGGPARALLEGHSGPVRTCAVSRDCSLILSGHRNGDVEVWDVQREVALLARRGDRSAVTACTVAGDSSLIISGHLSGAVEIWDARTGLRVHRVEGHATPVMACAASSDGFFVLAGGNRGRVWLDFIETSRASVLGRPLARISKIAAPNLYGTPAWESRFVRRVRRELAYLEDDRSIRSPLSIDPELRRRARERRELTDAEALKRYYEAILSAAEETGDRRTTAVALFHLSHAHAALGESGAAQRYFERAAVVAEDTDDAWLIGPALYNAALLYVSQGDVAYALNYFEAALGKAREVGDSQLSRAILESRGSLESAFGRDEDALRTYRQALQEARKFGDRSSEGSVLKELADLHARVGRYQEAATLYREALGISREGGDRRAEALILSAFEDLRRKASIPETPLAHESSTSDPVDCTVFAPPQIARGQDFLVQVFAHVSELASEIVELAKNVDPATTWRNFKSLEIAIPRGSTLTVELSMRGLEVVDPVQSLVWNGSTRSVEFEVHAPSDRSPGVAIGKVTVLLDSLPIGYIRFQVNVSQDPAEAAFLDHQPTGHARRYQMAFISYASEDRNKVLERVQMLKLIGLPFFQDVLSLDPGDRWRQKLYSHIDESDLFLLFWSSNARRSRWVRKECRRALSRQRAGGLPAHTPGMTRIRFRLLSLLSRAVDDLAPPDIRPVIIEGPPIPTPWPELREIQFDDLLVRVWGGSSSG